MNTIQIRALCAGLFFLFIFISGFWLSSTGKPLNAIVFTVHKIIALAAVVFLAFTVSQVHQVTPLSSLERAACLLTGLLFIATVLTGGLMSVDRQMPALVHRLHQVLPFLALLSTVATLYLFLALSRGIDSV